VALEEEDQKEEAKFESQKEGEESGESGEEDIYESLEAAEGQGEKGFRVDGEKKYYLPEGFSLPKEIYENLFEH
jgi:hypothetical protein